MSQNTHPHHPVHIQSVDALSLHSIREGTPDHEEWRNFVLARTAVTGAHFLADKISFAADSYGHFHRGIVLVDERGENISEDSGIAAIAEASRGNLHYVTPRAFKNIFAGGETLGDLFDLVDSYHPQLQAVIVVAVRGAMAIYATVSFGPDYKLSLLSRSVA